MLNEFFEQMTEAVFENFGPLNRFMGEGLMGPFGALRGGESQEEHAVQAALEMRTALNDLQERWVKSENEPRGAMTSLRINTGPAIVGKIGSVERMEFTSIGESINLALRHQGATRHRATFSRADIPTSRHAVASPSNRSVKSPSRAKRTALGPT